MLGAPYVAVAGPGTAAEPDLHTAEAVGRGLATAGAIVLTGGLEGVMAAACRGAQSAGGLTVGILPGAERAAANRWVTVALATGLGELRNGLLVRTADVLVALGGAFGTLSEVALALKTGVPVIGLATWEIDGVQQVASADEAVVAALRAIPETGPG